MGADRHRRRAGPDLRDPRRPRHPRARHGRRTGRRAGLAAPPDWMRTASPRREAAPVRAVLLRRRGLPRPLAPHPAARGEGRTRTSPASCPASTCCPTRAAPSTPAPGTRPAAPRSASAAPSRRSTPASPTSTTRRAGPRDRHPLQRPLLRGQRAERRAAGPPRSGTTSSTSSSTSSRDAVTHGLQVTEKSVKGGRTPCQESNLAALAPALRAHGMTYDTSRTSDGVAWPRQRGRHLGVPRARRQGARAGREGRDGRLQPLVRAQRRPRGTLPGQGVHRRHARHLPGGLPGGAEHQPRAADHRHALQRLVRRRVQRRHRAVHGRGLRPREHRLHDLLAGHRVDGTAEARPCSTAFRTMPPAQVS